MLADRNCSNGGDSMNDQMPFLAQLAVDIPECAREPISIVVIAFVSCFQFTGADR